MDILKSEFFYKFRNLIDPEYKRKDFSFYIHKIKLISPLSYELLGEDFYKKIIPLYFKEVVINEDNLIENIYYLPLFFKKYQAKFEIKDHLLELIDYEFTLYQIKIDPLAIKTSLYSETTMDVHLNPIAQAIQHEYDIHEYVLNFRKKPSKHLLPKKNKTLLLVSKNPKTNELIFQKGTINHAAIIDELHDGKMPKKDLLAVLQAKYQTITQSEWVIALKSLKENYFIIES